MVKYRPRNPEIMGSTPRRAEKFQLNLESDSKFNKLQNFPKNYGVFDSRSVLRSKLRRLTRYCSLDDAVVN